MIGTVPTANLHRCLAVSIIQHVKQLHNSLSPSNRDLLSWFQGFVLLLLRLLLLLRQTIYLLDFDCHTIPKKIHKDLFLQS